MSHNQHLTAISENVLDAMGVIWSRVRSKKSHRSPAIAKVSSHPNRRLLAEPLENRVLLSVGGGFSGAGLLGQYYNNTTFSGTPAFTRTDVRIDFNWGATDAPGGSTSPGFSSIGTTNYSVLWTGQVIPKYSQTYTFTATTNGDVQLYIQAAGSSSWTTLVNQTAPQQSASNYSGTYTVTAGASYNIKMMYVETTGSATAILQWSSPSTAQEIIEPVVQTGINGATAVDSDAGVMFADAMKMARLGSPVNGAPISTPIPLDAHGWPTSDGSFVVFAGQPTDTSGTYTMSFTGQANVTFSYDPVTVVSDVYNSSTNTTTIVFNDTSVFGVNGGNLGVTLTNTRRLPTDTTASGITNIKIMRPTSPGASTSYPPTTLFTTAYKNLVSQFTVIRFMDYLATNSAQGYPGGNATINWSDALSPSFSTQAGINGGYQGVGGAVEYAIELCNETDRDLWLNIPLQASDQYATNLAEGLKFGFDANGNPYTAATANPVYPPLNPNLKAYLELSNEVWNGGFYQNALAQQLAVAAVNNNTAIGQIINYDGIGTGNPSILAERWQILRTQQISNDFRAIWGSAGMMSTIRPIFQYQYGNANNTAADPLQFLDNYFNNTDGNHVATPEPVNYYLYAAGGGWYNTVNNASGLGGVTIANFSFESPTLQGSSYQPDPAGAAWTFSGTAGIVSNNTSLTPAATSAKLGPLQPPGSNATFEGEEFTVGSQNIYLYDIGRYVAPGNSGTHPIILYDANHNQIATGNINLAGQPAGQYAYVSVGPIELLAGQTYYLFSVEATWTGNDLYYNQNTTQTTTSAITVDNAESITTGAAWWDTSEYSWIAGTAGNHVGGAVNFLYATAPMATLGFPPLAQDGKQSAYIQGTGKISQSITFPAGVSDLTFYAAQGVTGSESFTVSIDGVPLNADWQTAFTPGGTNYASYTTATAVDLTAGTHTLTFQGSGNGTVFLDDIQVQSAAAMYASGVQSITSTVRAEVDWDMAFGLQTVGYEGGFEVGGDNPTAADYGANVDPQAQQATLATIDEYLQAGGNLPVVFNAAGGAYAVAASTAFGVNNVYDQNTPKLAAYQTVRSALPIANNNSDIVPGVLTPANMSMYLSNSSGNLYADSGGGLYKQSGWLSWNIDVTFAGTYTITSATTGAGGSYVLLVNEVQIASGSSGGNVVGSITLSPGYYDFKIRSTNNTQFQVNKVTLSLNGAPAAPTLASATFSNGQISLTWSAVTGVAGYIVDYGNATGVYTQYVNVGNVTTTTLSGLNTTSVYYLTVQTYDSSGRSSLYSNEIRTATRSTNAETELTFETLTVGATQAAWDISGYTVRANGNGGAGMLQVQGPNATNYTASNPWPGSWPSQVLLGTSNGTTQSITQDGGGTFDLDVIDLDAFTVDSPPTTESAVITGTDSSGATFSTVVNFSTWTNGHASTTVTLDWFRVAQVNIAWFDGSNGAGTQIMGAVDNVIIDEAAANPGAQSPGTPKRGNGKSSPASIVSSPAVAPASDTATTNPTDGNAPLSTGNTDSTSTTATSDPTVGFIADLYQDLLQRAPDQAGENYWVSTLDQGSLSKIQIARAFTASAEYQGRLIQNLYLTILDRPADPDGLQHWVSALANGETPQEVASALYGSGEYLAVHGTTSASLIQSYYQALLGRSADSNGLEYWTNQLQGGITPSTIAEELQISQEGAQHLIDDIYQSVGKTEPAAADLDTWTAWLQQGKSETDLLVSLLVS